MRHRITLAAIATALLIIGWLTTLIDFQNVLSWCGGNNECKNFWIFGFKQPLYWSIYYLFLSICFACIFSRKILFFWLKFAVPFVIVSLVLVSLAPLDCNASLMLCFQKVNTSQSLGKIFLTLTIIIVIAKSIHLLVVSKRNKK